MNDKPEALRLADWHKAMADEPKRNEAKRDKHRRTEAELRRLHAENAAIAAALVQQAEPKGGGRLPPPLQAEPVQEPDHTYKLIGCVQHDCEECQRRSQRKPLTGTRVADAIRARGSA